MGDLARLAIKYGSDKHGHHYYCDHYERHLGRFRNDTILLIELGIGGYHYPDRGGAGLKMWAEYFRNARIAGVDIHEKTGLSTHQIRVFKGSQDDPALAQRIINQDGRPSIVVDDASHMNRLTIRSFELFFHLLAPGGVYCVEDIESSWWEECGYDGCRDMGNYSFLSTVNFFRSLVNDVNHRYNGAQERHEIESIHFYPNLIFIHKK